MKAFLVAYFAVAVLAESDPNLFLTNGVYHTGLPLVNTYAHSPLVSSFAPVSYIAQPTKVMKEEEKQPEVLEKKVEVEEKKPEQLVYSNIFPTQYVNPFPTQYVNPFHPVAVGPRYVSKNGEVEHIVHKREADPLLTYTYPGFYHGLRTVVPSTYYTNKATFLNPFTGDVTGKITNDAIVPTNYASKGQYFARAPGTNTVHVAKREADPLTIISNPMMYRNPAVYSGLNPVVYNTHAISPFVYNTHAASPFVYNTPLAYKAPPTGVEGVVDGKTVADDAWQFTPNYASKGMYEAKTPGTTHRARREADPLTIYRSPFYNSVYHSSVYPRTVYPRTVYSANRAILRTTPLVSGYYY